jgi:hypothetical protein
VTPSRGLLAGAIALSLLAAAEKSVRAEGAATQVVLIQPFDGDHVLAEALARLRGELGSVGFVTAQGPGPDHDPRWELEAACSADTKVAITLRRSSDGKSVDVWLLDRLSQKTSIRRLSVALDSSDAPTILAVRTADLLRASLLELSAEDPPDRKVRAPAPLPKPPVPAHIEAWVAPERPLRQGGFASLGGAVLASPGTAATIAPVLRVGHGLSGGLSARATAGMSLVPIELSGASGSARVSQRFVTAELMYGWRRDRTLSPHVFAGAGLLHVDVAGVTESTDVLVTAATAYSALFVGGAGLSLRATRRLAVETDVGVGTALPAARLAVGGERVGTIGAPAVMIALSLAASL